MKYTALFLTTILAAISTANAADYPYQSPYPAPVSIKPDLRPSLLLAPSAPTPVIVPTAVSVCGLGNAAKACNRR